MAPNFAPGTFKIVSLIEGKPSTSVNHTLPAWQSVYLNGPLTTWKVNEEGKDSYRFSVGGYPFTGVIDDRVTATIHAGQNVEWIATYREFHDGYTISPVNDTGKGWTVADPFNTHSEIRIEPIMTTRSLPPHYFPTQLFKFERVVE